MLLSGKVFNSSVHGSGQVWDDLHTLDYAFMFTLDPQSLEHVGARLYATLPGSDWNRGGG